MHDLFPYASYNVNLPKGDGALLFNTDVHFASRYNVDPTGKNVAIYGRALDSIPWIWDAQVKYIPEAAPWSLQLWAKNLTDKAYTVNTQNAYFFAVTKSEFAAGVRDVDWVSFAPPRTVGVTFDYNF